MAAVIRHAGAYAHILSNLSALDIWGIRTPLIANIRSTPASPQYDHWAVAIIQRGEIILYNGSAPPMHMSMAEFLGVWSGLGIVVTKSGEGVILPIWLGRLLAIQAGIAFAFVLTMNRKFIDRQASFARGAMVIFGGSIGMAAVVLPFVADLRNYSLGSHVAIAPFVADSFRWGTMETLQTASTNPQHLLVDARYEKDYAAGTIPRAVNIPVYAPYWQIRYFLRNIDPNTPIVVFCQSKSCPFDETIGRNLALLGFRNITVTDVGWAEYRQQHQPKPISTIGGP